MAEPEQEFAPVVLEEDWWDSCLLCHRQFRPGHGPSALWCQRCSWRFTFRETFRWLFTPRQQVRRWGLW